MSWMTLPLETVRKIEDEVQVTLGKGGEQAGENNKKMERKGGEQAGEKNEMIESLRARNTQLENQSKKLLIELERLQEAMENSQ